MRIINGRIVVGAAAIAFSWAGIGRAIETGINAAAIAEMAGMQQMLELPVRVVDAEGKPVAGAKVRPWALRCSQGHGLWLEDDKRAGVGPREVPTDENGLATVLYPRFREVTEQIKTISVSLRVAHPEFAFEDGLHIDVPLLEKGPHEIKLTRGVALEVRPLVDDKRAELHDLYAVWSDGRSWQPGAAPEKLADGRLRFPAMRPGANSVLLVKLDGDRATHFSKIIDFELEAGRPMQFDIPMRPVARVEGVLSANVPRPVGGGRIKASTLPPAGTDHHRVDWFTWVPVREDGTFTIDWPAGERIQIIAYCDGFYAASGAAPEEVENPRDPATDPFARPQVFDIDAEEPIELAMSPLVPCEIMVVDEANAPVAGVEIVSSPNVGWWNGGSQIYCHPLVRGERLLHTRDYYASVDDTLPAPFRKRTGADGWVTLDLPPGKERLGVISEVYELPVFLGQRDHRVELIEGETAEVTLRLQPKGTEQLGEWDKLAGVVFGCSTREGRQICALPGVQAKMAEFTRRFREAKDQRDPQLLSEAYAAVAEAFDGVGDKAEAAKWRKKSAEQTAKMEASETN